MVKVKAALTRALNKANRMLPYAVDDVTKGRKKAAGGSFGRAVVGWFFWSLIVLY